MMNKQTAVDILYKFLYEMESFEGFDPYSFNHKDVFNQAKQVEREQIIEAHGNKQKTKSNPDSLVTYGYTYTGEMYYNDKFENKNNE
jgi:hypothetical protein